VGSSLAALMGLQRLQPTPAPAFSLVDQTGRTLSPASLRGRVVVLTFFGGQCDDICPVLAAELRQADTDLGASASHVTFVTVNTDPSATTPAQLTPAVAATGLGADLPGWRMLTGPLRSLDTVWRDYGVTVTLDHDNGAVAHTDVLYLVDPQGRIRYRARPFADESSLGTFTLPTATIDRWARGIATYAGALTGAA
jgi:protein SCO1/2